MGGSGCREYPSYSGSSSRNLESSRFWKRDSVDCPTPLILSVATPAYGQLSIDTSDGNRYYADLTPLSAVYCFPPNAKEWKKVSIDSYGLALVWSCRFEAHVDQVIGLAKRVEPLAPNAAHLA